MPEAERSGAGGIPRLSAGKARGRAAEPQAKRRKRKTPGACATGGQSVGSILQQKRPAGDTIPEGARAFQSLKRGRNRKAAPMPSTHYEIHAQFKGPGYVPVPNYVAQSAGISPEALGVLTYLASLRTGSVVRVCQIMERGLFSRDRWLRIAKELRDCGALVKEPVRGVGGKVIGSRIIADWPTPEALERAEAERRHALAQDRRRKSRDRGSDNPTVGETPSPTVGLSDGNRRIIRSNPSDNPTPSKDKNKNHGATASTGSQGRRSAAQRKGAATRRPSTGGNGKAASAAPRPGGAPVDAERMAEIAGRFAADQILTGQSAVVDGVTVKAGTPEADAIASILRHKRDAEIEARRASGGRLQ